MSERLGPPSLPVDVAARRNEDAQAAADRQSQTENPFGKEFEQVFAEQLLEADEFYDKLAPADLSSDARSVQRQALAGLLMSESVNDSLRRGIEPRHFFAIDTDDARLVRANAVSINV